MYREWSGFGDNVTGPVMLDEVHTQFAIHNEGEGEFAVWLYDEDGDFVFDPTGTYVQPLHWHTGAYNGTVECRLRTPAHIY